MKLGTITISASMAAAAIAAALLYGQCQHHAGVVIGKQLGHDDATDRVNAARAAAETEAGVAWRRLLDSLARTNRASRALPTQRQRSDSAGAAIAALTDSLIPKSQVEAMRHEKDSTIALQDSVIAQDSVGIRARDGRIFALEGSVRSYADTVVPNLTRDRNKWRKRALVNACGLGGTVGVGTRGADAVVGFTCRISLPRLPGL
jgi:hypothetical protein